MIRSARSTMILAALLAGGLAVSGCARQISSDSYEGRAAGEVQRTYMGTIENVRVVEIQESDTLERNKTGQLLGGLAGGVAGARFGDGIGQVLASVGGAIAGAFVGSLAEQEIKRQAEIQRKKAEEERKKKEAEEERKRKAEEERKRKEEEERKKKEEERKLNNKAARNQMQMDAFDDDEVLDDDWTVYKPFEGITTTPMDPFDENDCDFSDNVFPHVKAQCRCYGVIDTVPDDVAALKQEVHSEINREIYDGEYFPEPNSCDPANQALVWLSSGDTRDSGDFYQRFILTASHLGLNGTNWDVHNEWMAESNECIWIGIQCNSRFQVHNFASDANNLK